MLKDYLNLSDYQSTPIFILIKNETSGTEELDYNKVKLVSVEQETLVFISPKSSHAEKHNLTLAVVMKALKSKIKGFPARDSEDVIILGGKITEKKDINDYECESTFQLQQYDQLKWQKLIVKLNKISKINEKLFVIEDTEDFNESE